MPRKSITPELRDRIVSLVQEHLPGALLGNAEFRGELTLEIEPKRLIEVCTFLRDQEALQFKVLADLTAVDHHPQTAPRFVVSYDLLSVHLKHRLRLHAAAQGDPPSIETVSGVWATANWHERECWDLMGVLFNNHPDLRRIMLPEDWVGHPLQKDCEATEDQPYDYLSKTIADE